MTAKSLRDNTNPPEVVTTIAKRRSLEDWADEICLSLRRTVQIGDRTAERYMAIWKARKRLLSNSTQVSDLPPSYATLYQLARLPDDTLADAFRRGRITPDLQGNQVKALRAEFDSAELAVTEPERPRDLVGLAVIEIHQVIRRHVRGFPEKRLVGELIPLLDQIVGALARESAAVTDTGELRDLTDELRFDLFRSLKNQLHRWPGTKEDFTSSVISWLNMIQDTEIRIVHEVSDAVMQEVS
jgi:hypothetical protein